MVLAVLDALYRITNLTAGERMQHLLRSPPLVEALVMFGSSSVWLFLSNSWHAILYMTCALYALQPKADALVSSQITLSLLVALGSLQLFNGSFFSTSIANTSSRKN